MRENRTHGSEGGGAGNSTGSSYLYQLKLTGIGPRITRITQINSAGYRCYDVPYGTKNSRVQAGKNFLPPDGGKCLKNSVYNKLQFV